ncbi:MAG: phosphoribosylformylglycinamidine synthase [Kofleriaceae bacterium]
MSAPPLLLLGRAPALTEARRARRQAALAAGEPGLAHLLAEHVYVIATTRELTEAERALLGELLDAAPLSPADEVGAAAGVGVRAPARPSASSSRGTGPLAAIGAAPAAGAAEVALVCYVVPRLGTTSPWSSKATEIAALCGLPVVRRVERGLRWIARGVVAQPAALTAALHDRMTESVLESVAQLAALFAEHAPRPLEPVPLGAEPLAALAEVSQRLGLALSDDELAYLAERYGELGRDPTDVELMMFAQANSEHCRHKIFNARWWLDDEPQSRSLFEMIRHTTATSPAGVLSAYHDNAAVIAGVAEGERFFADPDGVYRRHREPIHILGKVETHNHPTAISPFPGAATGAGGEIRDEGATGRGGKPKAGLTGFSVGNLRIPGALQPWEGPARKPEHLASAFEIMLDGPLGAAAFNNEFGRPAILGYFRTLELAVDDGAGGPPSTRGYHKPVMLAGGIGAIRAEHIAKAQVPPGAALIVLGGPALLIGLGGGAASSLTQGSQRAELDFASVQRDNAEMQRRCQEVLERCIAAGEANPILSLHDVGAGGLSNALPELVHDQGLGARLDLRRIPSGEPGLSPRELWCNEAQERYVLAVAAERLDEFAALCARERAPYAVLGHATEERRLLVEDPLLGRPPVDLPLEVLLGKPPRMERRARTAPRPGRPLSHRGLSVEQVLERVLSLPGVGDKTFLVTIGDRTVGGQVSRDSLVGRFQVPVADCAITCADFTGYSGEAMALGERPALALLDAAAAARMAVTEALTNLAAAPVGALGNVKLSCNWMAAAGAPGEDARLYEAVRAVGLEFLPALGIAVPVGKDSMSMRAVWQDERGAASVTSPVTLVVTAFCPVTDVRRAVTPELAPGCELWLVELGRPGGVARLGGSALGQVMSQLGDTPPDLDDPALLIGFWSAMQRLVAEGLLAAYHDRSDGGLAVTLLEMAWCGGVGLEIDLDAAEDPLAALFGEEPGAVLAVEPARAAAMQAILAEHGLAARARLLGRSLPAPPEPTPTRSPLVCFRHGAEVVLHRRLHDLRAYWSSTTHVMQRWRDDASCADEEQAARLDPTSRGLYAELPFPFDGAPPVPRRGAQPRVAILREQGVNGHVEMAAAFTAAGFTAVDVHMSDLIAGRFDLATVKGLVACGGFSYGDVLGAGRGWAMSARHNERARAALAELFARPDAFALGVCNGCQMMAHLAELIPGAHGWPRFVRNRSEQFEARLSMVEVTASPSLFFAGMTGARLPIAVAHGEGRAALTAPELEALEASGRACLRFVDGEGAAAQCYPDNPNGSPGGLTGVTTSDGRVTILMPHPERVVRTVQLSWHPSGWGEESPWMRMFHNARAWVG